MRNNVLFTLTFMFCCYPLQQVYSGASEAIAKFDFRDHYCENLDDVTENVNVTVEYNTDYNVFDVPDRYKTEIHKNIFGDYYAETRVESGYTGKTISGIYINIKFVNRCDNELKIRYRVEAIEKVQAYNTLGYVAQAAVGGLLNMFLSGPKGNNKELGRSVQEEYHKRMDTGYKKVREFEISLKPGEEGYKVGNIPTLAELDSPPEVTFLSAEGLRMNSQNVSMLSVPFVMVPGGEYVMGCRWWQWYCDGDEKPAHTVKLNSFWIGKYEITQAQWKKVMHNNPSHHSSCGDDCPVESVSRLDVETFINKLNNKREDNCRYRLPTEAEWEYACRSGGKSEKYCGGDDVDRVAWNDDNSGDKTHPVGQKAANGLGIHDMSGNVRELVSDWYGDKYYANSPQDDPQGPSGGSYRVNRGGGWSSGPAGVRSAIRYRIDPGYRGDGLGLRLARTCP